MSIYFYTTALAKALDEGKFALMANLDLSSVFDVVNIDLLIERLTIIGLPDDIVDLISIWLKERSKYIQVKGAINKMTCINKKIDNEWLNQSYYVAVL